MTFAPRRDGCEIEIDQAKISNASSRPEYFADELEVGASSTERPEIIAAQARKPTRDTKVGMGLQKGTGDGHVTISRIDPASIFAGTPIAVGDECVSINGNGCVGKGVGFVSRLMRDAPDVITLTVQNPDGTPGVASYTVTEGAAGSAVGIAFAKTNDVLRVARIDADGPFAKGPLILGAECIAINGENCSGHSGADCERLLKSSSGAVTVTTREAADVHKPAVVADCVPVEKATKSAITLPEGSAVPMEAKPPTTKNCWSKQPKKQRIGIIVGVVAVLALIIGLSVGLTVGQGGDERNSSAKSNSLNAGNDRDGGSGDSSDNSAGCSRERVRCRVQDCMNEFNGFTGRLEYKCRYRYKYVYRWCGRC